MGGFKPETRTHLRVSIGSHLEMDAQRSSSDVGPMRC